VDAEAPKEQLPVSILGAPSKRLGNETVKPLRSARAS
jgi:hypothetical protein